MRLAWFAARGGSRSLLPIAAVLGASLVAGCGGRGDALHVVLAAAKTTLARPAISDLTLTHPALFGQVETPVLARGAFALPSGLGYDAIDLQTGQQTHRAYLVLLPTRLYLQPTAATKTALPSGKTWASVSLTTPESANASFPRFAEQAEGLSPLFFLDEIVWGAASASAAGEPVVNHVPFSKYIISVSLAQARAHAIGPSAAAMRVAIDQEVAALRSSQPGVKSPSIPITVLVDGPGRVVRIQATVPGSGLGTVSLAMSGFGTNVPTSLPPASQVIDVADLKLPGGASPWTLVGGL